MYDDAYYDRYRPRDMTLHYSLNKNNNAKRGLQQCPLLLR